MELTSRTPKSINFKLLLNPLCRFAGSFDLRRPAWWRHRDPEWPKPAVISEAGFSMRSWQGLRSSLPSIIYLHSKVRFDRKDIKKRKEKKLKAQIALSSMFVWKLCFPSLQFLTPFISGMHLHISFFLLSFYVIQLRKFKWGLKYNRVWTLVFWPPQTLVNINKIVWWNPKRAVKIRSGTEGIKHVRFLLVTLLTRILLFGLSLHVRWQLAVHTVAD